MRSDDIVSSCFFVGCCLVVLLICEVWERGGWARRAGKGKWSRRPSLLPAPSLYRLLSNCGGFLIKGRCAHFSYMECEVDILIDMSLYKSEIMTFLTY